MNRTLLTSYIVATLVALPIASFARQDVVHKASSQPQAAVASKTAVFATVKAANASVKAAVAANDLNAVNKQTGKSGTVQGTVAKLFAPPSNSLVVLNFADDYWTAATVVVRAKNFAKFPNLQTLKGKKVLVTGRVTEYKEKPQIEVSEPGQIKIIR